MRICLLISCKRLQVMEELSSVDSLPAIKLNVHQIARWSTERIWRGTLLWCDIE